MFDQVCDRACLAGHDLSVVAVEVVVVSIGIEFESNLLAGQLAGWLVRWLPGGQMPRQHAQIEIS